MDSNIEAFTYVTGEAEYDELPWVKKDVGRYASSIDRTNSSLRKIPALAESVQRHQSEPFGGLPTPLTRAFSIAPARTESPL